MKLNIGCGLEYKKGYVNVDAYDSTVADHVMSVMHLKFDDQTFSHVECVQVMEHLGAAKSIYALSEIFRVLKPGGSFLFETPDLVSSFKSFIKGDENSRKLIMNWIYGLDTPGMSHKYGFPKELIERMLYRTGFVDAEIKELKPKSIHPSLRTVCKKGGSKIHQTISQFRRFLIDEKRLNLDDQVEVIEKESLIQELIQLTMKTEPPLDDRYLKKVVGASAVFCPKIGHAFLTAIRDAGFVASGESNRYIEILETLDSVDVVNALTNLFCKMPIKPGFQSETLDTVKKLGKQLVKKIISGDQNAIIEIRNTSLENQDEVYPDYFSETGLELSSNRKIALGLKAFGLNHLDDALKLLQDGVRLNRDSVIAYWNLARISVLKHDSTKVKQYYSAVSDLLKQKHPTNYRNYIRVLDQERKNVDDRTEKLYARPIHTY
ncbi:MAG: methyltransferase domain-containing protein [Candidatus Thorarchaeota archaeon]